MAQFMALSRGVIREEMQFFHVYLLKGGGAAGGADAGVHGFSPWKKMKTKNAGEAKSGHFAKRLKSQIYLNLPVCSCFRGESPHLFFSLKCLWK